MKRAALLVDVDDLTAQMKSTFGGLPDYEDLFREVSQRSDLMHASVCLYEGNHTLAIMLKKIGFLVYQQESMDDVLSRWSKVVERIDTLYLVAGHRAYYPLVQKAKAYGIENWVLFPEVGLSQELCQAADHVKVFGDRWVYNPSRHVYGWDRYRVVRNRQQLYQG